MAWLTFTVILKNSSEQDKSFLGGIAVSLKLQSLGGRLENITVLFGKGLETDKVTE